MKKRCIFHVPNKINLDGQSGSQVRPMKMKQAFESLGYEVEFVMGNNDQKKKDISRIKQNIKDGIKYDFVYSESSTMPTLLSDESHLPLHPFLDFGFLKFCKKYGMKVGLFYRDIYWKYDEYRNSVKWYKRMVSVPMYKYDLKMYGKILDVLYLPSRLMEHTVKEYKLPPKKPLPPGAVKRDDIVSKRQDYYKTRKEGPLKIFYVGGITGVYDLTELLRAVKETPEVQLTICCRKPDWDGAKDYYSAFLTDRVEVVHVSGEELIPYYLNADICSCYFESSEYRKMAAPIKLFEYIGYVTPVIVTTGTTAGDLIEEAECGFSIPYSKDELKKLLNEICRNQDILLEKHEKALECLEKNTWEQRALQVVSDLKNNV